VVAPSCPSNPLSPYSQLSLSACMLPVPQVLAVELQGCSNQGGTSLRLHTQQVAAEKAFRSLHLTLSHGPRGYRERRRAEGTAHSAGDAAVGSAAGPGQPGTDSSGGSAGEDDRWGALSTASDRDSPAKLACLAAPGNSWTPDSGATGSPRNDSSRSAPSRRLQAAGSVPPAGHGQGGFTHRRRLLEYDMGCRCKAGECSDGHYGEWGDTDGCDARCG